MKKIMDMEVMNNMQKDRTYIELEIMFLELFENCKTEAECDSKLRILTDVLEMAYTVSVEELKEKG